MHVHILGICGTFMGGIAAIAKAAGHRVTGSDRNVYPPMSTQLAALGVEVTEGFTAAQLDPVPDVIVVGNVMSRGHPVVEAMLDRGLRYVSGPEWLAEHVLRERWVLGVAGTHGKTTTSSMLAWILEYAGLSPGFLIGGVPANFDVSARLGGGRFFVIEADEYDTAFFDKRAKFVHYRPRTLVLNNLEFDHADIYPNIEAIQTQFHHLLRTIPPSGLIVSNTGDPLLAATLARGCWTPLEGFAARADAAAAKGWLARRTRPGDDVQFDVLLDGVKQGTVQWNQLGDHNIANALAAIAAARHAGVITAKACEALGQFKGVQRRMELRGEVAGVRVYDDFAHHPTAVRSTIDGLRRRIGQARMIAVLEPRSNTMKLGVHRDTLGPALSGADEVWLHAPADIGWDVDAVVASLDKRGHSSRDLDGLIAALLAISRAGDHILIMSNGGFGGLHGRLLDALRARASVARATS